MVEEAIVVRGVLEGEDGLVDEGIEASEVFEQGLRKFEIHVFGQVVVLRWWGETVLGESKDKWKVAPGFTGNITRSFR